MKSIGFIAPLLIAALTGCGGKIRAPWDKPEAEGPVAIDDDAGKPRGPTAPVAPYERDDRIPVETFLVGSPIPERLKASALTVSVRSNVVGAAFECQLDGGAFAPCGGAAYAFKDLAHGQVGALSIRARAPDGQIDGSPLAVSFIVDMHGGMAPGDASTDAGPVTPGDLPEPTQPPQDGEGPLESRQLQLGSFFAVAVPYDQLVTSYSTSKTYNSRVNMLRLMGEHAGSAYAGIGCGREYERVVDASGGRQYCDGTPTRAQLIQDYARPLPYNHVELVRGAAAATDEKILIAAYDGEPDPVENKLGINGTCANSGYRGKTSVPVIADFFGEDPARAIVTWCQVRDRAGDWWWVGAFTARLGQTQDAPRVAVIYTAATTLGIVSPAQFMGRIGRLIPSIVVPIAPVGN
jgi:hypothetical protein